MERFDRIAEEFEVAIVEDAAQAIGAEWSGRRAGSLGVTAAFSFYPTKNLSAFGDAGIVTTSCPRMAEHMRRLRNHGSPRRYYHHEFGWNGRMDAIQAAVLRVKLPHIAEWNESGSSTLQRMTVVCRIRTDFRPELESSSNRTSIKAPRIKAPRRCGSLRGVRRPNMFFINT